MITTTYLALVAVIALVGWRVAVRRRGGTTVTGGAAGTVGGRVRAAMVGLPAADDDLVERMAACLVENTTAFGSSYAIPGYLGAELPGGVLAAAAAAKPQLTGEVLDRYQDVMVDRCRRLGRADFQLPADYVLRLALGCGPEETLIASFDPIVDVRAASAPRPRRAPLAVVDPGDDGRHTRHRGADDAGSDETAVRGDPDDDGVVVLLTVDGTRRAERLLGTRTPVLTIGRGAEAALRCSDDLVEVSRLHAELTLAQGRVWVEDRHSANGTWLQRRDGEPVALAAGAPEPVDRGDVVWLDDQRQATVTVL